MKIIESIREYINNCPALAEYNVNVNYLEDGYDTFSIEEVPTEPIIKRYIDGSSKRKCQFVFTSKEPYTADIISNLNNSNFYEDFSDWVETNNKKGIFPDLEEGLEPTQIKVISTPYVVEVDEDHAIYQIQLQLDYIK